MSASSGLSSGRATGSARRGAHHPPAINPFGVNVDAFGGDEHDVAALMPLNGVNRRSWKWPTRRSPLGVLSLVTCPYGWQTFRYSASLSGRSSSAFAAPQQAHFRCIGRVFAPEAMAALVYHLDFSSIPIWRAVPLGAAVRPPPPTHTHTHTHTSVIIGASWGWWGYAPAA